jgi:L-ascorbate metabolism protein UlaG (beta-lactamase superfamily)
MYPVKLFFCFVLTALVAFAAPSRPVQEFSTNAGALKITPINHASLMIEGGGKVIYVDPTSAGSYEGLPSADLILLTDIHGDHMDTKILPKLQKGGTVIYAPAAVAKTVTSAVVTNNGESKTAGAWTVEAIPMYNIKRGPAEGKLYHDKGRGNGYVLTYGGKRIYISGDTEGIPEMRALKNIDIAFVCMNLPYTMPPEEAADAVRAFHPKVVYPYHYRGSDLKTFEKALEGSGVQVKLVDWYYK